MARHGSYQESGSGFPAGHQHGRERRYRIAGRDRYTSDLRKKQTMMPEQLNFFEDQSCSYFLLISPDEQTSNAIIDRKRELSKVIRLSNDNLRSLPHLTLFKIEYTSNEDAEVIAKAEQALAESESFLVEIAGVEPLMHGKSSRTLALKVENVEPLKEIYQKLCRAFNRKMTGKFYPHVTIARTISEADYQQLGSLEAYDHTGNFPCSTVTILKKEGSGSYKLLHEVKLRA